MSYAISRWVNNQGTRFINRHVSCSAVIRNLISTDMVNRVHLVQVSKSITTIIKHRTQVICIDRYFNQFITTILTDLNNISHVSTSTSRTNLSSTCTHMHKIIFSIFDGFIRRFIKYSLVRFTHEQGCVSRAGCLI